MSEQVRQRVLFENLLDKPVSVEFTAPAQSSDGGVLLLKAIDEKMRLTETMARCIRDMRQPGKIKHSMVELLRERVFGIACGYPDGNDAARLADDPAMRMVCERRDNRLASQPTLSRLENGVSRTDLMRMGLAFSDTVLENEQRKRRRRKPHRITIDMDPTEDPTHGAQQLTFFNGYYDSWCYLPMLTTIQFNEEPEHYLVAPVLRPGNAKGSLGAISVLKRLVPRLRKRFPKSKLHVRLDGAFATPEVLGYLEAERLLYVVNMAKNTVLKGKAEPWLKKLRTRAKTSGRTQTLYSDGRYRAGTWKKSRRVIIKAEVVVLEGRPVRDNPRFLITNLRWKPKKVYGFYAKRGDMENRIRELKEGLRFDLTSCTSFLANQMRNLLVAGAYALFQQLRHEARSTDCARAQVWTLRERLIKVGVLFKESVRRILLEAPQAYAWLETWQVVAARVGASP